MPLNVQNLLCLVKKELDDVILPLGVVEEDKETPVDEPRPLLESEEVWSMELVREERDGGREGRREGGREEKQYL